MRFVIALALVSSALPACGDSSAPGTEMFPAQPAQTIATDHGAYHIGLRSAPEPPTRGVDRFLLDVSDQSGTPVDGLTIGVQPWMPAHGHGTSVAPVVVPRGDGQYEVDQVYFYMAGAWELRLAISGPENDSAAPSFQIP